MANEWKPVKRSDRFLLILLAGYFSFIVVVATIVIIYFQARATNASETDIEREINELCQRVR